MVAVLALRTLLISTAATPDDAWSPDFAFTVSFGAWLRPVNPICSPAAVFFPKDTSYEQRNLIYEKSTVTVGNYFECIHYMEGGFVPQYSIKYFFNNHRQLPYAFNAGMVLILIFVLNYIFMKEDWLKTIKEVRSQEPRQM